MTKKYTLLFVASFLFPALALAAPPPGVSGLQATVNDNGSIAVSWDELPQDDISYYNVYYSSESILGNQGAYEDYERTDGPRSSYTFFGSPVFGDEVYFAVLAMNTAGEESVAFAEEILVSAPVEQSDGGFIDEPIDEFDDEEFEEGALPDFEDEFDDLDALFNDLENLPVDPEPAPAPLVTTRTETGDAYVPPVPAPLPEPAPVPIPVFDEPIAEPEPMAPPALEEDPVFSILPPESKPILTNKTFVLPENEDTAPTGSAQDSAAVNRLLNEATNIGGGQERFEGKLHLLTAKANSATEISLDFSHEILIAAQDAPSAFRITRGDGDRLQIKRLIIDGFDVRLETEVQERGTVYEVEVSEPLQGDPNLPLDAAHRTVFFTGHATGKEPEVREKPIAHDPVSIQQPQDVTGFALTSQPMGNGLYAVSANWDVRDVSGGLAFYIVRQSLDGGRTFQEPQLVPAGVNGVDLQGVQPGQFGLAVQTLNQYQFASRGVFEVVQLVGPDGRVPPTSVLGASTITQPQAVQQPRPLPQAVPAGRQVPSPTTNQPRSYQVPQSRPVASSGNLPQSGTPIVVGTAMLIGSILGWRRVGQG